MNEWCYTGWATILYCIERIMKVRVVFQATILYCNERIVLKRQEYILQITPTSILLPYQLRSLLYVMKSKIIKVCKKWNGVLGNDSAL